MRRRFVLAALVAGQCLTVLGQVPPSERELKQYTGLHRAAAHGDIGEIKPGNVEARDGRGRRPLHVAAFRARHAAMRALIGAGANPNAALELGASANNVTSRYDGTALIAAAHLGHAEVVRILIAAGAPLDHVNNLGWTALMESIVLGDGGVRHTQTLKALLDAGADSNIADRSGVTPLAHARARGYAEMARLLEAKQAR
jgi:ankyrin repeat protein